MDTTQEEQMTATQPTQADPLATQLQATIERLGMLTVSLAQQREELAGRERMAESLAAELVQRRARIEQDEQELWRVQGATAALQQLQQGAAAQTQGVSDGQA